MPVMEKWQTRNERAYDREGLQNATVLQKYTNILEDEVRKVGKSCSVNEK